MTRTIFRHYYIDLGILFVLEQGEIKARVVMAMALDSAGDTKLELGWWEIIVGHMAGKDSFLGFFTFRNKKK